MATIDPRQHLNALLDDLGMMLGIGSLSLDEDDRCAFGLDALQAVDLFLDEERGTVLLATPVERLPPTGRRKVLTDMLQANFLWRGTEGATLALGPEDDVLLHRELPLDEGLDLETLHAALQSFVTVAAAWREYLRRRMPEDADAASG
jgi:hypothetical protein